MDRRELLKAVGGVGVCLGWAQSQSAHAAPAIPLKATPERFAGASFELHGREIASVLHTITFIGRGSQRFFRLEGYWSHEVQTWLDALPSRSILFTYSPYGRGQGQPFIGGLARVKGVKRVANVVHVARFKLDLTIESKADGKHA